ncbi:Ankyrin repeat domain-containing protein 26 [Plecturocebus cupreus]
MKIKNGPQNNVIAPMFEKANLVTHGLLQVDDDSGLSEIDGDERRAENKTSTEKNKVKSQIHSGADFADSMRPSETASECELSHCTYKNFLLLI